MTSTDESPSTSIQMPEAQVVDMRLEVVTLPVADVGHAKRVEPGLAGQRQRHQQCPGSGWGGGVMH